jgi:geranylgeranyl diphosphate synthase, type III
MTHSCEEGHQVCTLFSIGQATPSHSLFLVAHKIYGVPQTINSANYVYFLAYQELFSLKVVDTPETDGMNHVLSAKDLEKAVTGELLNLHRGQGLDLLWRDSLHCPTEEEYIAMVNNSVYLLDFPTQFLAHNSPHPIETGGLFRLAIKLLMACATTNTDVYVFASIPFQKVSNWPCTQLQRLHSVG